MFLGPAAYQTPGSAALILSFSRPPPHRAGAGLPSSLFKLKTLNASALLTPQPPRSSAPPGSRLFTGPMFSLLLASAAPVKSSHKYLMRPGCSACGQSEAGVQQYYCGRGRSRLLLSPMPRFGPAVVAQGHRMLWLLPPQHLFLLLLATEPIFSSTSCLW